MAELLLVLYVLCGFIYGVLEIKELSEDEGPKVWFVPLFFLIFLFMPVLAVYRKNQRRE